MAETAYAIDTPGPFAPPTELRAFLTRWGAKREHPDVDRECRKVEEYLKDQESRSDHEYDSG